jgi:hypothetical protein
MTAPTRDQAHDRPHCALLVEHVGAETALIREAERAVELELAVELGDLVAGQDARGEAPRVLRRELWTVDRQEDAVHANARRRVDGQVQVGATLAHEQRQQFFHRDHGAASGRTGRTTGRVASGFEPCIGAAQA